MIKSAAALGVSAFVLFVMSGCAALTGHTAQQSFTYSINVAELTSTVSTVSQEISQSEQIIKAHKASFSPKEWAQLKAAQKKVNKAQDLLRRITSGNASTTTISLAQVQTFYQQAKQGYLDARPVVKAHENALQPGQKLELKTLDSNARQLDNEYARVMAGNVSGVNVTQFLQEALSLAAVGAKIAVIAGA